MQAPFCVTYKPLQFADYCTDSGASVIPTLETLLRLDCMNVLLVGEAATGKTSLLDTLVREYYAGFGPREYGPNVLHINNLKEQGIQFFRSDVKTFCQTYCTLPKRKKLVVIDDLDTVPEQSQQVFRHYVDQYSHQVHFVASCSYLRNVIESLQSRLHCLELQPVSEAYLHALAARICAAEQVEVAPEAQDFVVQLARGKVKVLLHSLEKFKLLGEPITLEVAQDLCCNLSFHTLEEYTRALLAGDLPEALRLVMAVSDQGYSVMDVLDSYFVFVKTTRWLTEAQKYVVIPLLCKYVAIFHTVHEEEMELLFLTNQLVVALSSSSSSLQGEDTNTVLLS